MKHYAGVGSRKTPQEWCKHFRWIGRFLAARDYCLRSGRADGADIAFELGCDEAEGRKEIFLPTPGFGSAFGVRRGFERVGDLDPKAVAIARSVMGQAHWDRCNAWARKAHSRNVYQVLGLDLETPVERLICWAPVQYGVVQGGTATAVKIAQTRGIPVFNMYLPKDVDRLRDWLATLTA